MSGSRPTPAEQHLGDRLSALVDGELGHESRDRVLAHLATCAKCKAEADAQRRLKNVFAEVAPPPPSESFLARLQGLPAGGDSDGPGSPLGGAGFGGGLPGADRTSSLTGIFGVRGEPFGYIPGGPHADVLPPSSGRGFRIHDVSRHEAERSASRGLRFAFAAAGAVSLAAVALGGVSTGVPGDTADARGGSGSGSNVTPMRSPGTGASTSPESQRRRSDTPLLAQGRRALGAGPVAPTEVSAPLLPGVPTPTDRGQDVMHTLTTPVVAGAAAMSPLIRPLTDAQPLTLTSWSTAPDVTTPGLLVAPVASPSPASSPSPTSPSSRSVR
ncbi:membrane protein [Streptomyces albiflavescens]|uniref:Membrane protein n=1 Tax=Streptomyces albiflavescens TaxID=1623582 RepID=A0A918D7T6_9ACTN|nr:anti-sigma factor [Streptomyces albiflavescens]GGN82737.1 membrane protein [Streptomyces albiflavescens]